MTAGNFEIDLDYEAFQGISGIDEAGRGCLAGPVVIAAVSWTPQIALQQPWFQFLADSKQLSRETRDQLFPQILAFANRVKVAVIGPALIDYLNILRATLHGFELVAPPPEPDWPLLIDGNQRPPSLKYARTVVRGDSRVSAIAAAGIVAKVTRDRLMDLVAREYPQYSFDLHKGYATQRHREAILAHGPGPMHRKTFRPVSGFDRETREDDALLQNPLLSPQALLQLLLGRYHSFSSQACRKTLEKLTGQGLGILPTLNDPICTP